VSVPNPPTTPSATGSSVSSGASETPSKSESPDAGASGPTAASVGRGGLAITFAKAYFIMQGLVQQVLLPRVLGLDGYGALSSVLSAASITYNPIVTTSIQGVSRAVAQSSGAEQDAAVRRTFVIHAGLAVVAAASFFVAAPYTAGFMRAPHIVAPLRLVSFVLLLYGLYAPLIGALNGRRRFVAQATFDVVFGTLRTIALVVGGLLAPSGEGVVGAVGGFVAVVAFIAVAAMLVVGTGKRGSGGPTVRAHIRFVLPLLSGQILLNLLLQADLTLLRRFAGDAARASNLPALAADPLVGAYRATQLYSFLPYQLLISVTFVLFPLLATAYKAGDRAAVARYVRAGVRVAMLVAGLLVSVTSGLSAQLLRLVYSPEAAELGARAMQTLTLGFGTFAILGVLTAVLSSIGREREGATVVAVAFALVVALCFTLVRGASFGEEILRKTALSTSIGLVLAAGWAALLVKRAAGAVVGALTAARVALSLAIAILVARHLPEGSKVVTILESAVVAAIYVTVLAVSRELGSADVAAIRSIVQRRR
jgi:stage V sporulation protein B